MKELETGMEPAVAPVPMNAERQPVVFIREGEVFASSRDVAAYFGKEHRSVLASIDNLLSQEPDLGLHNFMQTPYVEPSTGQTYRSYDLTRDGFTLLAMGFTGAKALKWKLKYIEAFNVMESELRSRPAVDPMKVLNDPAAMRGLLLTYTEKVMALEGQVAQQGERLTKLDRIEAADGSLCITDAAKMLKVRPKDLFARMQAEQWIYRRVGGSWIGYQSKVQAVYLEHTEHSTRDGDGNERVHIQCRVTPKGIIKLSEILNAPLH